MTLFDAADRIERENGRGENVLPGKLTAGIPVFPFESIGEVDRAKAHCEVKVVQGFYLIEMQAKVCNQDVGQHRHPVILAFSIADDNLAVVKVQIFHPQADDFHQTESAAIHDLCHELVDAVHVCNHCFRLSPGKNGGNAFRLGRANWDQGRIIQLDVENLTVEKENCADRLVLGGSSDTSLIRQRRDKVVDLCHAHVTRMTLLMVQDKLSDPADVGLFGAEGVMAVAEDFAVLIEQLFGSS